MNFIDHLGKNIQIPSPPQRIISLVPSITELLFDLGLKEQIVGRTKFCIYPEMGYPNSKVIGGTKNVHIDLVRRLKPELVIANQEENVKEQVEAISKFSPTFTTVVKTRKDALKMIKDIGHITDKKSQCFELIKTLKNDFAVRSPFKEFKIVYLIWKKPYMTVGGDTYISNFLNDFGFKNCFENETRYPTIELSSLHALKPDLIMLSSEPYPFKSEEQKEIEQETGIKTVMVDGSYCSWYGSRMLNSQKYLRHLSNKLS